MLAWFFRRRTGWPSRPRRRPRRLVWPSRCGHRRRRTRQAYWSPAARAPFRPDRRPPRAGTAADDGDRLQRLVAVQFPHLAVHHDLDVREPRDLVDEVARHVLAQVMLADYERYAGGVRGKEDRRLPRRVAAADDRDRVPAAHQRLSLRR